MRRPSTLFWKLFFGTTLLIIAVLGTCAWLIVQQIDRFLLAQLTENLRTHAAVLESVVRERFDASHAEELDQLAKTIGRIPAGELRVTLILKDGRVLADSIADPRAMESHANRKEVVAALAREWGEDTHYSRTLDKEMKYVALRVGSADDPRGVVRVAMAVRTIGRQEGAIQKLVWTIILLGLVAAVVFAMGLARVWSLPIRRITGIARSLSRGDLSARVHVASHDEMGLLARSLNEMRDSLAEQLSMIDRQRRTLESLLTQLREGVIVAGHDGRIVLINPAAAGMLGIADRAAARPESFAGRPVEQCVLHHDLLQMLLQDLPGEPEGGRPGGPDSRMVTRQIGVHRDEGNGELVLLATASDIVLPHPGRAPDRSDESRVFGRMVVLTDITELSRMVRVKTDFAANASHELRTPLAAIRGAIETLTTLDWATDEETARRFLGMIDRQSGRMLQMVSDLLDLSRIESSPGQFKPQELSLRTVFDDLHSRFRERLTEKNLQWTVDLAPELNSIILSPHLLRSVMDNLVDNAIKFTDPGGRISVTCRRVAAEAGEESAVSIAVEDTGCGIAENEQERVFERFYQVEKARSGPDRGTGLGLSIVRHAVAAMHGSVALRSKLGEGTCITVIIPQQR
jgi:two-component system, OmpR family, phosphate regulon sensor histidine kinase PhoR